MTEPTPPSPAPRLPTGPVTVRFAPSPTGLLHVGNARTGLINWLFARQQGGSFLLRIDDTDRERSTSAFEAAIFSDLAWLGLSWDKTFNQSARSERYAAAAERLRDSARLYPCYETALDLDTKRKRQLARRQPPVYDRAALRLSAAERAQLEAEGRRPHWRFRLSEGDVAWHDLVRGRCHFDAAHLSDPVLIREDGTILYTMTSVVDDIDSRISHVLRGEDHVTNTAVQIQLFEALGAAPPTFAHLPLLTDREGHGLSKRLGSLSIAELRDDGLDPMAINSLLARLGTSDAVQVVPRLDDLVTTFDIGHFGRGTPKFDIADLHHLNARLLHDLPFAAARPRLESLGINADEDFWLAVRGNLGRFREASDWWRICRAMVSPTIEDADLCAEAATLLPAEPWSAETWKTWTQSVAGATGRTGRALYHPLRLALTGRADGPELKTLLPLIGRPRSLARLTGQAA